MSEEIRVRVIPYADHLAAVSAARREALEDAAHAVMATGRMVTDGMVRLGRMEQGYAKARSDAYEVICALAQKEASRE